MNKYLLIIVIFILFIIIPILGLFFYNIYWIKYMTKLTYNPIKGNKMIKVSNQDILGNHNYKGLGWTLHFWIYVKDWSYKYNQEKRIFVWDNIIISLDKKENNILVKMPIYNINDPTLFIHEELIYKGIPIQKWINVVLILDNRNLDLYINGKLYSSKYLSNLPKFDVSKPMYLCPSNSIQYTLNSDNEEDKNELLLNVVENNVGRDGFSGYINKARYYSYPLEKTSVLRFILNHNITRLFEDGPFKLAPFILQPIMDPLIKLLNKYGKQIYMDTEYNSTNDNLEEHEEKNPN